MCIISLLDLLWWRIQLADMKWTHKVVCFKLDAVMQLFIAGLHGVLFIAGLHGVLLDTMQAQGVDQV